MIDKLKAWGAWFLSLFAVAAYAFYLKGENKKLTDEKASDEANSQLKETEGKLDEAHKATADATADYESAKQDLTRK